jgi:N utilization substance protein B
MLPRRHIRIKVFQTLYTYFQQVEDNTFHVDKALETNLKDYLDLYYLILDILIILRSIAAEEISTKQKNFLPTKDDLNPNKKFIENKILKKIKKKTKRTGNIDEEKLKSLVKSIFKNFQKRNTYIQYMNSEILSHENEKKIIIDILKNHIITNEKMHDFMEEYSIYWNDDLIIAYNIFIEKINKNENLNTLSLFRNKEDEFFAKTLLTKTINKQDEISSIIHELANNWDKERIALIDLILMKMAIVEMKYIKTIPNKVTIDEYIEISKQYSTPKSKEFINGILDAFIKTDFTKKMK